MLRPVKQEKRPVHNYSVPVYKVSLIKESSVVMDEDSYSSPDKLAKVLSRYYSGVDREHFVVVMLDGRNRIIGFNTVSIGSLKQAIVEPREVFKPAIASSAAAVILSHNHPAGDPGPSIEDRACTDRLKSAGDILGIKVLDHVIMGDGMTYFSFAEEEGQKKAQQENDRENEILKRRIKWAEQAVATGRATGEQIVLLAEYRIRTRLTDITNKETINQMEEVVQMLTPVSERKRGPVEVRRSALDWIKIANVIIKKLKSQQQKKAARNPLTCSPGCVPGMVLKIAA